MDKAIVVFSRKGLFQNQILAKDIRSREHARKLWPLVSTEPLRQMVTWVSPVFKDGKLQRRSHFRKLPVEYTYNLKKHFDGEEVSRQRSTQESQEHRRAKELIAAELTRRLDAKLAMPWWFRDEDVSDFPLEGNLLLGANRIVTEYLLHTPFSSEFRLDIAVLGPPIKNTEPMVLGGVEIELNHAFDGRKALLGKSLGFPLISIDITEMSMDDLTPQWAQQALSATTCTQEQGRRQTYIYLHDLLYPLYAKLPAFLDHKQRHQFLVFADDATLEKLSRWINVLAKELKYQNKDVMVMLVNGKNEQSRKMLENAGEVVGPDWKDLNSQRCLRLTLPRPRNIGDIQAHRFHMTMARLLLSRVDALVGYNYCNGLYNDHPEEDVWIARQWIPEQNRFNQYRVLPKRLAAPISRIIELVSDLRQNHETTI